MSKKIAIFFVFAITLLSGCSSCQNPSSNLNSNSNSAPLKTTLRLKYIYDPGFAGEMVAAKAGFFKEKGLEVELKPGGFEADPIKLVATGSDTFGVAGADTFLQAREKGVPIVAFAAGYIDTPVVYYSRSDSGISSPQDFVGKRVGYQAGQDTATVYEALIRKAGVDRQKIKEVPVRFDFTPFLTKQVDVWPGYAATQSYILQRESIPYNVIVPSQYGITYMGTVYFTTEKFISEHPEAVQAFVDALIKGWEYTYSNYDAAIPLIASYDEKNLTPDLIRFNLDKQKSSILPPGTQFCDFTMDRWEATQRILVDQKLLNAPLDLRQAMTTRFLDTHYQRGK